MTDTTDATAALAFLTALLGEYGRLTGRAAFPAIPWCAPAGPMTGNADA